MEAFRQESTGAGKLPAAPPDGAAAAYLKKATAVVQKRLGGGLWSRLDKRTRSCLVTSQVFHEMLVEVAAARDQELDRTGKHVGQMEAPEVDFSPVVLCLFKAIEIEIERKIYRPFRGSLPPAVPEAAPTSQSPDDDLESLATFVRCGKPTPNLKFSAQLFGRLKHCRANHPGVLGKLKHWMQGNLLQPERWWRDDRLCRRLQQAIDLHRNAAAHTGRLTPLQAQKAVAELWGEARRPGLIHSLLRIVEAAPVAASMAGPSNELEEINRAEICTGMLVQRTLLLKPRFWLLDGLTQGVGEKHLLLVAPGDVAALEAAQSDFRARRQVSDECLLRLDNWYPAAPQWGSRIVIASRCDDGDFPVPARTALRTCGLAEAEALARSLARATAALHRAGLVHGFISPHMVFRGPGELWRLGGQGLLLLAQKDFQIQVAPSIAAPEVNRADVKTWTPAADVYAIAATVCSLRAGAVARNAGRIDPADIERLIPAGALRAALSRALSPNPKSRQADAIELLAALTGKMPGRGTRTEGEFPVVVSYSRKDDKEAEPLLVDLAERGIQAWRDKDMIPGGAQWRDAIVNAIDNCKVVIFLVSKHSMESEQVPKELDIAADSHKVILPVCLDDTKIKAQFRYLLAGMHRLEFFTDDRQEGLNQLLRALREHGVEGGSR